MPELPEVETVKNTLKNQILNEKIQSIDIYYEKMLENVTSEEFQKSLVGQTLTNINRYGKYLIFIFNDCSIIAHMRMEGKFFLKPINEELAKHEHIVFNMESGISLRYHDTRRFGKMVLLPTVNMNEIMKYKALSKLGPEANDQTITPQQLYEKLNNKRVPIKVALLDQEIIAGLGNIYVDEVCFLARLHPQTPANLLTIAQCEQILQSAQQTLKKAIKAGGTTIRSYTSSLGVTGRFQLELNVHTKVNQPCPNCQTTIEKIRVGGRGTYYCPNCQKLPQKLIIGITGGIATGKSIVLKKLIKLGYNVIDADFVAKKVVSKSSPALIEIAHTFGSDYLLANGELDRKKMSKLIFNDEKNRQILNNIIHPRVKDIIKKNLQNINSQVIFVDVPLLYEAHFEDLFDKIIVVFASYDINLKRLIIRDQISEDLAKKKIAAQMNLEEKCQKADFIIDNSQDLCYTYKQLDTIIEEILK